jgi:hypothetical protein
MSSNNWRTEEIREDITTVSQEYLQKALYTPKLQVKKCIACEEAHLRHLIFRKQDICVSLLISNSSWVLHQPTNQ